MRSQNQTFRRICKSWLQNDKHIGLLFWLDKWKMLILLKKWGKINFVNQKTTLDYSVFNMDNILKLFNFCIFLSGIFMVEPFFFGIQNGNFNFDF